MFILVGSACVCGMTVMHVHVLKVHFLSDFYLFALKEIKLIEIAFIG
jgi:hypothetical protein